MSMPTQQAWDYADMFANGWRMEPSGNGRENGRSMYWCWRKRGKKKGQGYIYGGLIADLPCTPREMNQHYRRNDVRAQ